MTSMYLRRFSTGEIVLGSRGKTAVLHDQMTSGCLWTPSYSSPDQFPAHPVLSAYCCSVVSGFVRSMTHIIRAYRGTRHVPTVLNGRAGTA